MLRKFIAVVILGLSVGLLGGALAENGDHQQEHINHIERKYSE